MTRVPPDGGGEADPLKFSVRTARESAVNFFCPQISNIIYLKNNRKENKPRTV